MKIKPTLKEKLEANIYIPKIRVLFIYAMKINLNIYKKYFLN
jgi:hypothetical protein